ncbi:MAG TPA: DUF5618 family protein [Candidatus Wunengus sp. YC60]|uniref:DUF5618 family protein n=1 Tax=Candidatus Wunengus sp. YC60 TaxID=3367697 RepID=UPI004029B7F2
MKEALRYLQNARDTLNKISIEDDYYVDIKPVREALGTAYLAILEAINEALLKKGLTTKELPQSVEEYRKVLRKHFVVHNGKLMREFEALYNTLHIAGHYRGLIQKASIVKDCLKAAKEFIRKFG